MPEPKDPNLLTIKVTTSDPQHAYYVQFDRAPPHDLRNVLEYKSIFSPTMGVMATKTKTVVNAARTKIPETVSGEPQ